MQRKALVLDANVLIRACSVSGLGVSSKSTPAAFRSSVAETAYAEAKDHLAALVMKRGGDPAKALVALQAMAAFATMVGDDLYGDLGAEARKRLGARDPELADSRSLALGCPI